MDNPCIVTVLLEEGLDKPLSYLVPDEMIATIKRGMLVEIPVKSGMRKGYVLSVSK
jgi:primosomal protein N'